MVHFGYYTFHKCTDLFPRSEFGLVVALFWKRNMFESTKNLIS